MLYRLYVGSLRLASSPTDVAWHARASVNDPLPFASIYYSAIGYLVKSSLLILARCRTSKGQAFAHIRFN